MRSLRLVVPATLVILSLSFAPAQAATGDDPGSGGFLGHLFRSLPSSTADEPPADPGNVADPPVTQPVDSPPAPKNLFKLPEIKPLDPPPNHADDPSVSRPFPPANPDIPPVELPTLETPSEPPSDGDPGGPTASDDHYDVEENSGATSMSVTSNDSGTITAVQAASMPANGELDQTEMTSFSYTPNADFVGSDSFTYQAKDANQATSNTATVTINVTPQGVSEEPIDDPSQGDREGSFNDEEEDEGDDDDDGRRHHKHDDDDDDDGDRRCHRHHHQHDHDHDHDHHGHHGDHDGDHDGDNGDNEWDEWKKDWNHDWDDDDHGDKDDDDGDLPDTGSPVNLPLLALSGLLVIAGVAVVRRTRG